MFEIRRAPERGSLVTLGVIFSTLLVLGLLLLAFIINAEPGEVGLLTLPLAMTLLGLLLGGLFVQRVLARRIINEIILELETPMLHLDDHFEFRTRFTPRVDMDINHINATFECVEKAYYRAGTRSRMYTRVAYKDTKVIAERLHCRANHELSFGSDFHTPADGMCTFHGANNAITWNLRVHVDVARWPDVKEDFEVQLLPVLGERVAGA